MKREEILEMAREAGALFDHINWVERDLAPVFERFAFLVIADFLQRNGQYITNDASREAAILEEREACAQEVERESQDNTRFEFAAAIRARGN